MKGNFLRETLAKESRAYGFTIAFWGSGALLVNAHGLPSLVEALLYGFGAVVGFGLLTLLVYKNALKNMEYNNSKIPVLGMVHYIAALLPIAATYYTSNLETLSSFFITGLAVSILYNLGMVVEEFLDLKIKEIFHS